MGILLKEYMESAPYFLLSRKNRWQLGSLGYVEVQEVGFRV